MARSFISLLIELFQEEGRIEDLLRPILSTDQIDTTSNEIAADDVNEISNLITSQEPFDYPLLEEEYLSDVTFDRDVYINLLINLSQLADDIFKLLNASILHGEYFSVTSIEADKKVLLESASTFISQIKAKVVNFEQYYVSLSLFFKIIDRSLSDYDELITGLRFKVKSKDFVYYASNNDRDALIEEVKHLHDQVEENYFELQKNCVEQYRLFKINVNASRTDFLMQSADFERLLDTMLTDIKWMESLDPPLPLMDAVRAKCQFLWLKIKNRIRTENKESRVILSDGVKEIKLQWNTDAFNKWNLHTVRHYEIDNSYKELTANIVNEKALLTKRIDDILELSELHILIKYFKDCTTNDHQAKLGEITAALQKRYLFKKADPESNIFDVFAYSIDYNYSVNNQFSAYLEPKQKPNYVDAKKLYNEVLKIQEITGISNFFPQWKYLQFLIENIKTTLKNDIQTNDLSKVIDLISEAKGIYDKYRSSIVWFQNTYNYIFYLDVGACSVMFTDKQEIISHIFVASSFNLPLMKDRYLFDFNTAGIELASLESTVQAIMLINEEHKEIKARSEELHEDAKNKETKYIEILGIFGAVITFASAAFTTQLSLSKGQSISSITNGMVSVGIILVLFILLLIIVTRFPLEKIWKKTHRLGMQRFGVAVLIGVIFCLISGGLSVIYSHSLSDNLTKILSKEQDTRKRMQIEIYKFQQEVKRRQTEDSLRYILLRPTNVRTKPKINN